MCVDRVDIMLSFRAALVLRIQALVLFLIAFTIILRPFSVVATLGFPTSAQTIELSWTLRFLGLLLLMPALLAPLLAAFAGERGLRQASSGLGFINGALCMWLAIAPGSWSRTKVIAELLVIFLTCGYFFALRGRRRNR